MSTRIELVRSGASGRSSSSARSAPSVPALAPATSMGVTACGGTSAVSASSSRLRSLRLTSTKAIVLAPLSLLGSAIGSTFTISAICATRSRTVEMVTPSAVRAGVG